MSRLLESHGYEAMPFPTGRALLDADPRYRFHCILLDLDMPEVSGFDVLEALQGRAHAPPVIVVTAHLDRGCARRAMRLHAFDCQVKPVRAPQLIDAIERACMRAH